MASIFNISLLIVAVFVTCSAKSIGQSYYDGAISTSLDSGVVPAAMTDPGTDILGIESAGPVSFPVPLNEDPINVQAPGISTPSYTAAFSQNTAQKKVNAEERAAEKDRKKARAEARMGSARFNAIRHSLDQRDKEAQMRTESAAVHLAKANAAAVRKVKAAAEEKTERKAAKRDEVISEEIREKSARTLALAEKEADNIDQLVAKLNKEAADHEAKARAAMAKVAVLSSSVEAEKESEDASAQTNAAIITPQSSQTGGSVDYDYDTNNETHSTSSASSVAESSSFTQY